MTQQLLDCPAALAAAKPVRLAVIGAGPRGAGFLERIAANLDELWDRNRHLVIHVIDPHPPGAGRIWRHDQSPLLKLNSMAADVTMFTDESSTIEGPVVPGPSLVEWAALVVAGEISINVRDAALHAELHALTASSFPTRRLQSLYLEWFYRRALAELGGRARVVSHSAHAVSVDDAEGTARIRLDNGDAVDADIVLYALGHTGTIPDDQHSLLIDFAGRHDLFYLPPAFTADADTSTIEAGSRVIVRGMGLAAVDLTVLLTEGRGGRFVRTDGHSLTYIPSGQEPRLVLGSRRGVPYHSKISSQLVGERPTPTFFTPAIAAELESRSSRLDFREQVWPLIAKEMLWGYYRELFTGHPERVSVDWLDFAAAFARLEPASLVGADGGELRTLVTESVPDPLDHLFLSEFDRPLAGTHFGSGENLQSAVRDYIRRDLVLRTRAEHSATQGLFIALLTSLFTLSDIIGSPKWTATSRVRDLNGWWPAYFSYIASGPPAHRLEELLALSEAGIVEFIGGEMWVDTDEVGGQFRAGGPNSDVVVTATVLIDARLPETRVARTDSAVLRSLVASGAGLEERVKDDVFDDATGKLAVARHDTRVLTAAGELSERRYAIGPYTNTPFVGAFSRPLTNAIAFRENDRVARAVLSHLTELAQGD
ncbi:FAD/NAD(P)-binding protein [Leifsonia sp. A12D58]|uniref:FAD/NAD(P)-binding protein n=1 Tax=Leifsonia sp. A12D58 TaxID=3397674 RepID=UPI0039E02282